MEKISSTSQCNSVPKVSVNIAPLHFVDLQKKKFIMTLVVLQLSEMFSPSLAIYVSLNGYVK